MENKKNLTILIAVLAIVALILVAVISLKSNGVPVTGKSALPKTEEGTGVPSGGTPASATKEAVPEGVVVPEQGSKAEEGVAIPSAVAEAAPGVSAKLRHFEIKAENGAYVPSTIIVNLGDSIYIDFMAVGNQYDIVIPDYGLAGTAKAGETKIVAFQANIPGKFVFYSALYGGIDGKMKGYIIVK